MNIFINSVYEYIYNKIYISYSFRVVNGCRTDCSVAYTSYAFKLKCFFFRFFEFGFKNTDCSFISLNKFRFCQITNTVRFKDKIRI